MGRAAILIMVLTIVVKASGFLRDIALSYFYGASGVSDAYIISLTIPSFIFAFISVSITTGYIPIYTLAEEGKGFKRGIQFTNNLLNLLVIICTVIVLCGITFTDGIVKIFASGFSGETLELAVMFTRISIIGVYFSSMMAVFRGFLQVKNRNAIPALVALPNNLIILFSIYISAITEKLIFLAIGTFVGAVSQVVIMLPYILKEGYKPKFFIEIKDEYLKKFRIIAFPVILGISINEINVLIDRTLASRIVEGAISALDYSFRLTQFINGTFAAAIAIAIYPVISRMIVNKQESEFKQTVFESINVVSIIVIPITVISMIYSGDIVSFLYGRGAFDQHAIKLTSDTLFYYSIGMLAYGHREILSRAFYANQDSRTPMVSAALAMGLNIILNIILSFYMGTAGLALATSIAGVFGTVLLFTNYKKRLAGFSIKDLTVTHLKLLLASLIMGMIAIIVKKLLASYLSDILSLVCSVIVALLIYIILLLLLKIDQIKKLVKIIKNKRNK